MLKGLSLDAGSMAALPKNQDVPKKDRKGAAGVVWGREGKMERKRESARGGGGFPSNGGKGSRKKTRCREIVIVAVKSVPSTGKWTEKVGGGGPPPPGEKMLSDLKLTHRGDWNQVCPKEEEGEGHQFTAEWEKNYEVGSESQRPGVGTKSVPVETLVVANRRGISSYEKTGNNCCGGERHVDIRKQPLFWSRNSISSRKDLGRIGKSQTAPPGKGEGGCHRREWRG